MAGIGHNSGNAMEPGQSWRKHAWAKARKQLLPTLPIEVVRLRVKRAAELGLPYKTYAGIRASSGHDLIGFLFSSNALRVLRDGQGMPADRVGRLASLHRANRVGIAHRPVSPNYLASLPTIDAAFVAPEFQHSWAAMRDRMKLIVNASGRPADRFLLVGDTAFEREWAEAAFMAGYMSADQYFGQPA